ncbi:ATP-binding cassette domain-containing protein [Paraburkholderia susongensis]|uniref:Oligopeptide transport system ATP-binding protein n=1 Tax=Paraburkholderia susongensis TaxID=1515439 RepID=A0A1X7LXR2_9BURK|nr:ATP-binding cassette domain-containing protein [Paraburkholderia susongensis]SMG58083.1 oligopeptide transport system ATP-binding protein [Paraburkholderia susongensis]
MLFELNHLSKSFADGRRARAIALDDVSLSVDAGEAIGLVGESGSGKTTLIRCALRLLMPDSGSVVYDGMNVVDAGRAELRRFRREVQPVFQDPFASLNPRMNVEQLVGEGLIVHGIEKRAAKRRDIVVETLEMVGLGARDLPRYTQSFSGGQRQRIAIARALAIRPRLLICDEPVSALDVSVQAQVINLLQDMQRALGLTILFIAHDLAVVRHFCERIYVLHHGRVVESGDRASVFDSPRHPYTQALLGAMPIPDPVAARERRALRKLNRLALNGAAFAMESK